MGDDSLPPDIRKILCLESSAISFFGLVGQESTHANPSSESVTAAFPAFPPIILLGLESEEEILECRSLEI